MREILFRGKLMDGGGWVEGACCPKDIGDPFGPVVDRWSIIVMDGPYSGLGFDVVPDTVGQYTGLTDKNGKKIFEGDILLIPFEEDRSPWEENCINYDVGQVYFSDEHHGWFVRFIDVEPSWLWEYDDCGVEVVGNIYDNPGMMGGTHNGKEA